MDNNSIRPSDLISLTKWRLRMSDEALAKLLNVSWGKIHLWEAGKGEPEEDIIRHLESLLGSGYRGR